MNCLRLSWRIGSSFFCWSALSLRSRTSRSRVCSSEGWPLAVAPPGGPLGTTASPPAGRNLSAAFGSFSTLDFSATTSFTFAVMPGRSLPDGLSTATTTVYVTTFWTTCAAFRICVTRPTNVSLGNASTVKVAWSFSLTRPMSASSTLVSTCIFVRSWAIVKSTGAWRLAATVWPTSTWRETTTPSTGALIVVWSRST